MKKLFFVTSCIVCCMVESCTYESVEPEKKTVTDSVISYSKIIAPLTTAQCSSSKGCHEGGSQDGDFTTYNGLKEKAVNGTLFNRVVKLKDMPLKGSAYQLTDAERDLYNAWIAQGFANN